MDFKENSIIRPADEKEIRADSTASIQTAIEYINEHYTEQITLERICKVAMMSRTAFTRMFKKETGDSLVEYVQNLRISKAKQLLCENKLSVTEIGVKCGFDSTTYFDRIFRKKTGRTPREYIKQSLEDDTSQAYLKEPLDSPKK